MTYNKFIRRKEVNQLSIPERSGLITYLRFKGVVIIRSVEESFIQKENFDYYLLDDYLYVLPQQERTSCFFTLEELKLYASYFTERNL